jgi:hypothetical protein
MRARKRRPASKRLKPAAGSDAALPPTWGEVLRRPLREYA